ncbi:unnamed protein product [Macrosiphum euphorbiae]|uniref:Uncharacterized protein n=1 Tax=Macrosiphum euphorbiae TaxID=13131 RepID=A0AAV0XQC9_9HEMI|nr:unnamed protein product [Macrosiphum euphorbiae]
MNYLVFNNNNYCYKNILRSYRVKSQSTSNNLWSQQQLSGPAAATASTRPSSSHAPRAAEGLGKPNRATAEVCGQDVTCVDVFTFRAGSVGGGGSRKTKKSDGKGLWGQDMTYVDVFKFRTGSVGGGGSRKAEPRDGKGLWGQDVTYVDVFTFRAGSVGGGLGNPKRRAPELSVSNV